MYHIPEDLNPDLALRWAHLRAAFARFGAAAALRAVRGAFLAERDRWALWLPAAVGTGAALYFVLPREPAPWVGVAIIAVAAILAAGLRRSPGAVIAALAVAALGTGFAAAQARTAWVAAPVIEREIGPVEVTGRIVTAENRPADRRLTLAQVAIADLVPEATPARVRVTVRARGGDAVAPGDWVSLRAVLLPPSPPAAPGAFDFARYAWFDRLGGVGYAVNAPAIVVGEESGGAGPWLAGLRHRLSLRISDGLPGREGAVASALMTGDRGAIDDGVWQALRDSGLAHLLAISGLHVGLVAGILFFAVRAGLALAETIAVRFPIKKWAAVAALFGAFGYVLLTGGTVPTQRAYAMLALVLLAVLLDRRPFSMRLVAWAAVMVLVSAPEALLGPSFQMSFAAVAALIATYEIAREPLGRWRRGAGPGRRALLYLAAIGLTTLVAGLATAPFALYHFNRVASYGLAANLFAVPITSLWIMPWAMVGYALMPFGLEGLALAPMGWGIAGVLWIAETVAAWPGAAHSLPAMPTAGIVLVALGGLWLCLWRTRWRLWGGVAIVAGLATTGAAAPPDILINDDARYFAVRNADGGLMASSSRSNYTVDSWLRRDGLGQALPWPKPGEVSADGRLRCDGLSCIAEIRGVTVALVRDERAFAEDCGRAAVVVAAVPAFNPCAAEVVVDRFDVWWEGAHAIWIGADGARVLSVSDERGDRPWVLPRHRPRERPRTSEPL